MIAALKFNIVDLSEFVHARHNQISWLFKWYQIY